MKISHKVSGFSLCVLAVLLAYTYSSTGKIWPLNMSFVTNTIAKAKATHHNLTGSSKPESIISADLLELLHNNPLGAGDALEGEDFIAIERNEISSTDIGCTEVYNSYARSDIPVDGSTAGDMGRISVLHQGDFQISVTQREHQVFLSYQINGEIKTITEVYCAIGDNQVLLSQQDNYTYVILEFNDGIYTGEFKRYSLQSEAI
jgi:hypothetical protein